MYTRSIACSLKAFATVTTYCLANDNSLASLVLVAPGNTNYNEGERSDLSNIIKMFTKLYYSIRTLKISKEQLH